MKGLDLGRPTLDDALAGLLVSALLLPQSLAYALLAGLPPLAGVMASLLPLLAYALIGSSTTLAVGPVAVLALMIGEAVGRLGPAHGVGPMTVALVLAAEVGLLLLLTALLRLDALGALLSSPVMQGFVSGSALAIAYGQLVPLLGLQWAPSSPWPQLDALTAGFGLAALLLLVLARQFGAGALRALGLAPARAQMLARMVPLLLVGLAIAAVAWLQGRGQAGALPLAGRIALDEVHGPASLAAAPLALWRAALPTALMVALVGYVSSLGVAQGLGARRQERVLPRRELLGLAAANGVAALSGGMPIAGSFSRSGLVAEAGARTRWTGIFMALAFAFWISLGARWLALLPQAVLAATIIVAVLPMAEWQPLRRAWRYSRAEGLLMGGVTLAVPLLGVEMALGLGVLGSVALLLQRTARPHWAEVGRIPGTELFRNTKRFAVELLPGVLAIRIDEGLRFTNAHWVRDLLCEEAAGRPQLRHLVLMMSGVNEIDLSGLEALQQLALELRSQGRQLHLSELKGPVADRLYAAGLEDWLPGRVFRTQMDAWHALMAAPGEPASHWVSP
ncbi:SulP family inorganic anion transporter [Inhella proteolytica]|uniref:STAS domain-containing protein n=1 Tax=Inhella proteolytica TaxID=2795029 RepID=A0A931J656_9BURK|nr:SulP family inorganic anion transporter [Inhella proteolytica]MBH9576885.1 STAS domain-containing protein [Inhella proteolytica]